MKYYKRSNIVKVFGHKLFSSQMKEYNSVSCWKCGLKWYCREIVNKNDGSVLYWLQAEADDIYTCREYMLKCIL
jgi:predicted nucleic-acid-binding Zn-ribbon protein